MKRWKRKIWLKKRRDKTEKTRREKVDDEREMADNREEEMKGEVKRKGRGSENTELWDYKLIV